MNADKGKIKKTVLKLNPFLICVYPRSSAVKFSFKTDYFG